MIAPGVYKLFYASRYVEVLENVVNVLDNTSWVVYRELWNDGRVCVRPGEQWFELVYDLEGASPRHTPTTEEEAREILARFERGEFGAKLG